MRARLAALRLVVVTDLERIAPDALLGRVAELLAEAREGTVAVQLRDRERPVATRLALGRALRALTERAGALLFVNDRLDLASAVRADGVHLGEGSVDTRDARRLLGAAALVSRACHDPARLSLAAPRGDELPDAWLLSPVFDARKGRPPLGVDGLCGARVALERLPVALRPALVALGGVSAENAAAALTAGADAVAAIGAALGPAPPGELLRALGAARGGQPARVSE